MTNCSVYDKLFKFNDLQGIKITFDELELQLKSVLDGTSASSIVMDCWIYEENII